MTAIGIAPPVCELSPVDVQKRFDWAQQEGHPLWLWPNEQPSDWQNGLEAIERATRAVIMREPARYRLSGNSEAIGIAAYTSGMGPLLGYWLEKKVITADSSTEAILARHLAHNRSRMTKMAQRAKTVIDLLYGAGISPTVLKGMHTAFAYFPEPGTRALSDLDILISEREAPRARKALAANGFVRDSVCKLPHEENWRRSGLRKEPRTLRFVHSEDPWSVDLHMSLDRPSAESHLIELDLLLSTSKKRSWALSPRANTLNGTALVLHLAVHAGCSLYSLNLLRLTELSFVIRAETAAGRFGWKELQGAAEDTRALDAIYPTLNLLEALAPETVPRELLLYCESAASQSVRRVVHGLSPANAQNVLLDWGAGRFMWSPSMAAKIRQITREIALDDQSFRKRLRIYPRKAWRLVQMISQRLSTHRRPDLAPGHRRRSRKGQRL